MYINDIKKSTTKKFIANFRQICYISGINLKTQQRSKMMKYVQNKDGTLSTETDYKQNLNWEGNDHKDQKIERTAYQELGVSEKTRVSRFMKKHPELATTPERAEYFRNLAARELIEVRNENNERVAAGKTPLVSQDYELSVPKEGVVISAWRAKRDQHNAREAAKSSNSMYNDAVGNGSREF